MKKIVYESKYYKRGLRLSFFDLINYFALKINTRMLINKFGHGKKIIEIGCGKGEISKELSNFGYVVDAVDVSKEAILLAKRKKSKVNFLLGDIFILKRTDNYYDHVFSFHVMEHIKDIEKTLFEVKRILKIGGKFIVRIPNSNSFEAKIAGKDWFHWDEPYHVNHFSDFEFVDLLKKSGFKEISINYHLFEFRQVLLYSLITKMFKLKSINNFWKYISMPLQFIFVPISCFLGFFKNSGTIEITSMK